MPIAVVTGASTGIGRELAFECARDGYDLILTARSRAQLEKLAESIGAATGRSSHIIACDLSEPNAPAELFDRIGNLAAQIEILINNAGFGMLGQFWTLSEQDQTRMVHLNIGALTHLTRLILPGLIERGRGRIMNVASTAAFQPGPLMAVYYASKAYVLSFSVALNNETRSRGVTVTALCPGATVTEFAERAGFTNPRLFKSRMAMSAAQVARLGYKAMKRGTPVAITGRVNALMAFLTRFAPLSLTSSMARRFQESQSKPVR
jgi:short-subunit dehydrogenase